MPFLIEATLLYISSLVVFILAGPQRRAIRQNLSAIWHDLGWIEGYVGVFRVFVNFGWTYIDGLRTRLGQEIISWDIEGKVIFDDLREGSQAALIMTTHTGNYDLAAALFSEHFGRVLNTVRVPEKSEHLESMRRKELASDTNQYPYFKIHYNESQSMLGVKLAQLLGDGELVAIQCDRIVGEVSALEVPISNGWVARIPKGPLTLAAMTKCPCIPLYVVRTGYRHYTVIFQSPLSLPEGRNREKQYGQAWTSRLMPFLEKYGLQWFAFEEAFVKK